MAGSTSAPGTLMARDQLALAAGRVLWGNPSSTEAEHLGTADTDLGSSAAQKQLSTQPCLFSRHQVRNTDEVSALGCHTSVTVNQVAIRH